MIILHAKTESGTCYIKTANLDGETNLKQRAIPKNVPDIDSEEDLFKLRGMITCEKPNPRLYDFKGSLIIKKKK